MDRSLVAAARVLEVDHAPLSSLRGVLEEEAVKDGGQIVVDPAALANLGIGHTIATQQLQGEPASQRRAGYDRTADMRGNLTEISRFEVDEVDLAGRRPGHRSRAADRGLRS